MRDFQLETFSLPLSTSMVKAALPARLAAVVHHRTVYDPTSHFKSDRDLATTYGAIHKLGLLTVPSFPRSFRGR
jgi:hypothetical protein